MQGILSGSMVRWLLFISILGISLGFVVPPPSSPPAGPPVRTLLIDNYDSYTYNLAHYLAVVNGAPPIVVYNDESGRNWERVKAAVGWFDNVVISPGPGSPDVPEDFGISAAALNEAEVPILGICLGHQGLGSVHGGRVVRAPAPMHGRLARIRHSAKGIFHGLPPDFLATRYHSLVVERPLSNAWQLEETAWTADGLIMGLEHRDRPHYGVQFHPESIGTEHGHKLLRNFRDLTLDYWAKAGRGRDRQANNVRPLSTIYDANSLRQPRMSPSKGHALPKAGARYNVLVRRVKASPRLSSETIFTSLYGEQSTAFWLDSSAAEEAGNPSLLSLASDSPASCPSSVKGKFSFMGGAKDSGRLGHVVEYYYDKSQVGDREEPKRLIRVVRRREGEEEEEEEVIEDTNILAFLKDKVSGFQDAGVEVKEQAFSGGGGDWVPGTLPFEFWGGYVGYLGYELKDDCLAIQREPQLIKPHQHHHAAASLHDCGAGLKDVPDSVLVFADRLVAYDHTRSEASLLAVVDTESSADMQEGSAWLVATEARVQGLSAAAARGESQEPASSMTSSDGSHQPADLYALVSAAEYKRRVEQCLDYIKAGESYEVCLTSQICTERSTAPFPLYSRIRQSNPAPFSAFLRHDPYRRLPGNRNDEERGRAAVDRWVGSPSSSPRRHDASTGGPSLAVCCSSPERFLRVGRSDGVVESRPIKGTVRRGKSRSEDAQLAASLAASEKNRAENLMIVDLVRNDLSRVAVPGSVQVPSLMNVEGYATVHQLVSTVTGRLDEGKDAIDAVVASFPGGSMTGAPKKRTMDIIDKLEARHPRGVYSGSLGWIAMDGRAADLNIVIRTALVTPHNVTIGAGGAVVAMSDPEDEYQEMVLKAQAVAGAAFRDPRGGGGPRVVLTGAGDQQPSSRRDDDFGGEGRLLRASSTSSSSSHAVGVQ